uniref:Uncharacterized protein n=1 Tax=Leptospirillum sp. Group II '5-way CG' TaxID=419541 RepID=B6AQC6_9BACT|nr:MAG: Hypothetical protein CGL2_10961062 [Leptospirillum sp. Group II '5-way CG']
MSGRRVPFPGFGQAPPWTGEDFFRTFSGEKKWNRICFSDDRHSKSNPLDKWAFGNRTVRVRGQEEAA